MSTQGSEEPLQKLAGLRTHDGWLIVNLVSKKEHQTGSCFSVGYRVRHDDGREGFLKALDFSRAARAADPGRALELLTATYNFERDVLALCARLSKVVLAISDGALDVAGAPLGRVLYLIFELADGDVRGFAKRPNEFETIWSLRALHNIAVGLSQLHTSGVYHQDLKPSNVLVFEQGKTSKLADLGRAHAGGLNAPHDVLELPGAPQYAPPEQLYAYDWGDRISARAAADLYLLGSMLHFFFMGTMFTPSLLSHLRPEHLPRRASPNDQGWSGAYKDVLPFLRDATASAVSDFAARSSATFDRLNHKAEGAELVALLTYLIDPEPESRGHPAERAQKHSDTRSLSRFVSAFNRIAGRCEWSFRKADAATAGEN